MILNQFFTSKRTTTKYAGVRIKVRKGKAMTYSYQWTVVRLQVSTTGIVTHVAWECRATRNSDGQEAVLSGSSWFDPVAVVNNEPDPLTGVRNPFVELGDLTDAIVIGWLEGLHAEGDRAIALSKLVEVEMGDDPDDEHSPPPVRN